MSRKLKALKKLLNLLFIFKGWSTASYEGRMGGTFERP